MPTFRNSISRELYLNLLSEKVLSPVEMPAGGIKEIMLSVAQTCNLGCTYCFADQGKYGSVKGSLMQFDVARKTVDNFLQQYGKIGSIKFFGGEPLMNYQLIEGVCDYFARLKDEGSVSDPPVFALVTNLTLIPDGFLQLLKRHRFFVTVSLDGPPEINDAFRTFHNTKGTFATVDKNLRVLKDAIGNDVRIEPAYNPLHTRMGMSMVDLYDYMLNRYEIDNVLIHPIVDNDYFRLCKSQIPVEVISEFEEGLYDNSMGLGKKMIDLVLEGRTILEVGSFIKDMQSASHVDAHCGLGVDRLNVNPNGDINPCYTLTNVPEFTMGNVLGGENSFSSERFRGIQERFFRNRKSSNETCANCDILSTCNSCPGMMYHQHKSINETIPLLCDYYVGKTEGLLLGLNSISKSPSKWSKFVQANNLISQEFDSVVA